MTRRPNDPVAPGPGDPPGAQPDIDSLRPPEGFPCPHELPATQALVRIIACLRAPEGCPWDREQDVMTMAPHLLEEAFEAVDALGNAAHDRSHDGEVQGELGDVLMNVLMIAQIASESGRFDFEDVARVTAEKLVRRHPHVFGDQQSSTPEETLRLWESIKRQESGTDQPRSALAGVPRALPALQRALRVSEKAARVGFDWQSAAGPRRKVDEELAELDEAQEARKDAGDQGAPTADLASHQLRVEDELGDVLFSLVNWARHAGVHPETALRRTVDRFDRRFRLVETELGDGLKGADEATLLEAWNRAKAATAADEPPAQG